MLSPLFSWDPRLLEVHPPSCASAPLGNKSLPRWAPWQGCCGCCCCGCCCCCCCCCCCSCCCHCGWGEICTPRRHLLYLNQPGWKCWGSSCSGWGCSGPGKWRKTRQDEMLWQSKLGVIPGCLCWGCGALFLAQAICSSKAARGKSQLKR